MAASDDEQTTRLKDCWFLTGPTASGKTAVGIELALRLDAEIISIDSMALYRGLDIGTAKPTAAEIARVPHHLIDVIEPHEASSVAQFVDAAVRTADEIRGRGKRVLFVGGSPLYLKALLLGLFDGPPADWDLRQQLVAWAEEAPPDALHARLTQVDPQTAERLHPRDTRRLVRALEVFELTGRPISQWQTQFERSTGASPLAAYVLSWPRDQLNRRIDERVEAMFTAGLVAETAALLARRCPLSRTARQAVGYREVLAHLEQGVKLADTIELVKTKTRQFAKRQLTWFRSLKMLREIAVGPEFDAAAVAVRIQQLGQGSDVPSPHASGEIH